MHFLMDEKTGTFQLNNADRYSELYLPLANEGGVMNSITPDGHGDSKISQNEFLMLPVSAEELKESMYSRNFWCRIEGYEAWSVWGTSARQQGQKFTPEEEELELKAGLLWQKTTRTHRASGLKAEVLNFCPPTKERAEIMQVTLINTGEESLSLEPVAAVPIYARSADNLRDHRHVTSLLNRISTTEDGVEVIPVFSFDERGHQVNHRVYGVYGREADGGRPTGFYPLVADFAGESGSLYWPQAVVSGDVQAAQAGEEREGYEALGGICFAKAVLKPGESKTYLLVLSYDREGLSYLEKEAADGAFEGLETYWNEKNAIMCHTSDERFNCWMKWVGIQPSLRRIYGCSFLPHHDYGRGGRGWRDLWQDCLALILTNPAKIRGDLVNFYSGVRLDGSNATIIGTEPGEFKADRNTIVRVWMDHGYWPVLTTKFYLDQTGDYDLLFEEAAYFCDGLTARGEQRLPMESAQTQAAQDTDTWQRLSDGTLYTGSVLEHMLVQNVTQFFDVGEHNHMRLRGADWNDALDMAKERGESVAFTAAYSGNYHALAEVLRTLKGQGKKAVMLSAELAALLDSPKEDYDSPQKKKNDLIKYYEECEHPGEEKQSCSIDQCIESLEQMAEWIHHHIRATEAVEDDQQGLWFNGYYDNDGEAVERKGDTRMMLTSQVFAIMSQTAADDQVEQIVKSADRYLYEPKVGGYRLNTNFHEVKSNMGRAFGFAYGHKENGAVFSHMAVMYAYALYSRGFATEGYKVIKSLQEQAMDFERSGIYPGIPEYFSDRGKGLYHYLTGAASWLVLTVATQIFGVRGQEGNLILAPQLMKEQFDEAGNAEITVRFAQRGLKVIYQNIHHKEIGDYEVEEIYVDGEKINTKENSLQRAFIESLDENEEHIIKAVLS